MNRSSVALVVLAILLQACRQRMSDNGRIVPLQEDKFFADRSSARNPVPGTVSRESTAANTPLHTGKGAGGEYVIRFPVPVDNKLLDTGQEKYGIYCSVCHGEKGAGDGIVVKRGFTKPQPFQSAALTASPPGRLFSAMTEGFGTMDTYRDLVDENDRWAIAAYIKEKLQGGL